jgi:formate--tetrahydrofolate ligase
MKPEKRARGLSALVPGKRLEVYMKTDIEIARDADIKPITEVAARFGLKEAALEPYGRFKAKITDEAYGAAMKHIPGKLVLVTAVNPTPAGEGKTTTTIGLAQALNRVGKRAVCALREPSLGPCFGVKGGAAGGGYSQVIPMEDINLHFTGDFHAIGAANNILAAMLDNHLHQGNALDIDPKRIVWKRCLDMNDRALRNIVIGLGGKGDGFARQDGFVITVASEIMAILCLAEDKDDLIRRLGDVIAAFDKRGNPVTARDLRADGAMAALLKDAFNPNIVQTLEGTLAVVHGGPFANIAHGCNSIRATRLALALSDVCVTEAGFGADLGAEKFIGIKCRQTSLWPDAAVIVATIRALKYHGGIQKDGLASENIEALGLGLANLKKHIENIRAFGIPAVVALNIFSTDTSCEVTAVRAACERFGARFAVSEAFSFGGAGGEALAREVLFALEEPKHPQFVYPPDAPPEEKIRLICERVYGAERTVFSAPAKKALDRAVKLGFGELPVCMAKTQYSLSDDPALTGAPSGFTVNIRDAVVSAGAGFIVAYAGDIMTMPGLPASPAAERITLNTEGHVDGLF